MINYALDWSVTTDYLLPLLTNTAFKLYNILRGIQANAIKNDN